MDPFHLFDVLNKKNDGFGRSCCVLLLLLLLLRLNQKIFNIDFGFTTFSIIILNEAHIEAIF
jgi:hypothetical protein